MNLNNMVRQIREIKGLKQKEFAKAVGITDVYANMIERGKVDTISMKLLNRMSEELAIPIQILIWFTIDEGDVNPNKLLAYKELKPVIDNLIQTIFID
jgi:transcriptional regulator with XRE-family HTH domain